MPRQKLLLETEKRHVQKERSSMKTLV